MDFKEIDRYYRKYYVYLVPVLILVGILSLREMKKSNLSKGSENV